MASVSKNMTPLRRVRSSFLPRLGNVAGLAQLRPELEILAAKIPKKKTSQMLVSKFPSNHHNLDGLDFSRYKKKYMAFYGYLSHQSKSLVFFSKNLDTNSKNPNPPPTKKHVFDTVPSFWNLLVKVAECTRSPFWHRSLSQVFVMVVVVPGNHGWDLPWDFGCPRNVWKLVCNQKNGSRMTFDWGLFICDTSFIESSASKFSFMSLIIWAFPKLKPQSR